MLLAEISLAGTRQDSLATARQANKTGQMDTNGRLT
jgi:hypothetical protein